MYFPMMTHWDLTGVSNGVWLGGGEDRECLTVSNYLRKWPVWKEKCVVIGCIYQLAFQCHLWTEHYCV